MATMTTRDLGAVIRNVGVAAQKAQKDAVFNAAFHMKNVIEGERSRALKGKDYFSSMMEKQTRTGKLVPSRPESNRLTLWFNVKGVYNPTALMVARGPWGILEYGTKQHDVFARSPIQGRSKKAKYLRKERDLNIAFGVRGAYSGSTPLRTPYGPRYKVGVRGVKPKKPFKTGYEKSVGQATKIATSLIQTRVIRELRTQFDTTTYLAGESGSFKQVVG